MKNKYPKKVGVCIQCAGDIVAKNSSFDKPDRKFCNKSCKATWENKRRIWTLKSRKKLAKTKSSQQGRKHLLEERIKHSERLRGSKSHFWKGGLMLINDKIRQSFSYKLWREAVFKRDNYTCIWCGAKNGEGKTVYLNADHIKPFALFPELRFAIDNGRTLCKDCHRTTETFGRPKLKFNKIKL